MPAPPPQCVRVFWPGPPRTEQSDMRPAKRILLLAPSLLASSLPYEDVITQADCGSSIRFLL